MSQIATKDLTGEPILRSQQIRSEDFTESEGVVRMKFPVASDTPCEHWGAREILSHQPGAMVFGERQKTMPLLFNHDMDKILGVVEEVEQDAHRTYATVRFSKTEEGQKALALVKEKVLVNVSVRFLVREFERPDDDTVVVTSWELFEVSLVTVPADPTVGVYRNLNHIGANMSQGNQGQKTDVKEDVKTEKPVQQDEVLKKAAEEARSFALKEEQVREAERSRASQIFTLCGNFGISDGVRDDLVRSGRSLESVRSAILEELGKRSDKPVASSGRGISEDMGLTAAEKQSYSVIRAINASLSGDWSRAGFEREVSRSIAQMHKLDDRPGFFMPTDLPSSVTRSSAYNAGSSAAGGALVATDLRTDSFIELLRNKCMVMSLGATVLRDLRGNVEIPRQTGASTVFWLGEDGEPTVSSAKFENVSLKPKTVGSLSNISRTLLIQSSMQMEGFVRAELAKSMALGIDLAALSGSGANNEPLGIANQPGICSIVGGENGAALTFDHLIQMETMIADENADIRNMFYLCNAATVGYLKTLKDKNGQYLWRAISDAPTNRVPGNINGYPVARSNQVRKNLTKGTAKDCSELFFGNWEDLIIGEWGFVEIDANRYGDSWRSGGVEVKAMQSLDINVRHPKSFCVFSDARIPQEA